MLVGAGAASSKAGHSSHFGPYPSYTTDSGTCGPDWSADNVTRFFTIRQTGTNTYDVREKFKHGTFTTFPGPSPGACDNSDGTGPGIVAAGVTGKFHGYDRITVTSATYHPNTAMCPAPCASTDVFLISVFGPVYTRDDYAFAFNYNARGQGLVYHHWRNASCNRGGNHGDIQSAPGGAVAHATCP
jgi:hypothetical protein